MIIRCKFCNQEHRGDYNCKEYLEQNIIPQLKDQLHRRNALIKKLRAEIKSILATPIDAFGNTVKDEINDTINK